MRTRLAAGGLLLAAFALGAVAGGVGVTVAEHRAAEAGKRPNTREGYLTRLTSELGLSGEQRDSIRAILEQHKPAMDSMWGEVRPRFDSLRTGVRQQIRRQLTPAQLEHYDELLERRDREYRERRGNGGR